MPARSNRRTADRPALIYIFAGMMALMAIGCAPSDGQAFSADGAKPVKQESPVRPAPKPDSDNSATNDKPGAQTALLTPDVHGENVILAASTVQPAAGEEPAVFLANASLKAVHSDSAKALSVRVKNRIALIEFSPEIEDGFGSFQEANFIKALQMSLGQLPDVDKFQILVNGQPIESLGHFEVSDAQDVIRPTTIKP
jgi:hypothetical protein